MGSCKALAGHHAAYLAKLSFISARKRVPHTGSALLAVPTVIRSDVIGSAISAHPPHLDVTNIMSDEKHDIDWLTV